jgi:hypothetical protein
MGLTDWLSLFIFPWGGALGDGLNVANDILGTDVTGLDLVSAGGDALGIDIDLTGLGVGLESIGTGLMILGAAGLLLVLLLVYEDS